MSYHFCGIIKGVEYKPTFKLPTLNNYDDISEGINKASSFIYIRNGNKFAVSWWVSSKRTRSYPYARVYNILQFSEGKKVTIIPVMKDEGLDGDRDFIQWDTVSLMSLLNVYVIIGYYVKAKRNHKYQNKVTDQEFDYKYLENKFDELSNYFSDALHWNIQELSNIKQVAEKALNAYKRISQELGVKFHNLNSASKRINGILFDVENFRNYSRTLSLEAQHRESVTHQPKEKTYGSKGTIDIRNSLGGLYHFTIDEVFSDLQKSKVCLVEAKHTKHLALPSDDDIKDGLLKMILYTNLKEVYYVTTKEPVKIKVVKPMIRLTNEGSKMNNEDYITLISLLQEAKQNNFEVLLNDKKVISATQFVDFNC